MVVFEKVKIKVESNSQHVLYPTTKEQYMLQNIRHLIRPNLPSISRTMSTTVAPIEASIISKLTNTFTPSHLEVVNESFKHNVPKDSETHFKVTVVSSIFNDHKLIARHRLVNAALAEELEGPVHALSISAKTPVQWEKTTKKHETPSCTGGDGSLPSK